MTNYCFAERRRELYIEAYARGCLAAILDFPQRKGKQELVSAVVSIPDEMRGEVCCIPDGDDLMYRALILAAWGGAYSASEHKSERELASLKSGIASFASQDEALALIRHALSTGKGLTRLNEAYTQLSTAMSW